MNYLGLDYGAKYIGVAVATGPLAEPLATISDTSPIADFITALEIDAIVVGDCPPEFLTLLQSYKLPVHQVDETLSSHDARQALLHTTQKRRKLNEHSASAALILQTWLDQNQVTNI